MACQHDRLAADPPAHLCVEDGLAALWRGVLVIGALMALLRCAGAAA